LLKPSTTRKINVAIDGPAGAGKSTVARMVAKALGYIYVDTGAMYRAVTLEAIRQGIDIGNTTELAKIAADSDIRLVPEPDGQKVLLDGEDVSRLIRSVEVTNLVSKVSAVPEVRTELLRRQRELADRRGVVMDGRDIGTNVLPDAEVKVFMTASVQIRAERRWKERNGQDESLTFEELMKKIEERDRDDIEREVSPLKQAEDAVLLDTSDMSIEEAANAIVAMCRQALEG